jgi:hypothetical protein
LGATKLRVLNNASPDNLDGFVVGAVATRHLQVHLGDSSAERSVSVLLVHVHSTSAGEVTKNDTVVSDASSLLLKDLAGGDDFALNLTDLVLPLHMVPELGPGEHGVWRKHTHSVKLRIRGLLSGESSTDDVVLSQLYKKSHTSVRGAIRENEGYSVQRSHERY